MVAYPQVLPEIGVTVLNSKPTKIFEAVLSAVPGGTAIIIKPNHAFRRPVVDGGFNASPDSQLVYRHEIWLVVDPLEGVHPQWLVAAVQE